MNISNLADTLTGICRSGQPISWDPIAQQPENQRDGEQHDSRPPRQDGEEAAAERGQDQGVEEQHLTSRIIERTGYRQSAGALKARLIDSPIRRTDDAQSQDTMFGRNGTEFVNDAIRHA